MLDVTDFEQIFAETPVLQPSSESPVTSEDEGNPITLTQQVEKPSEESPPPVESVIVKKVEQKNAAPVKPTKPIIPTKPAIQATPAPASRKTELPTKQEFKDAKKERTFIRLLERLGFTLSTHGNHRGFERNGYRIPVPDALPFGTRMSIFKQATAPARNSEGKRD